MMAASQGSWTATSAAQGPAERMPFSHAAMCMSMCATASVIPLRTDVTTSVSLYTVTLIHAPILLVTLVVLISILLTCLTGLVGLKSLVGLVSEPATRAVQGV